jgi:hypothetical protein
MADMSRATLNNLTDTNLLGSAGTDHLTVDKLGKPLDKHSFGGYGYDCDY